MARIDDYLEARRLGIEKISGRPLAELARRSGYALVGDNCLVTPFCNRSYHLKGPEFGFDDANEPGKLIPLQEQVLILHYIGADELPEPMGRWIAYREIPGAAFYMAAFVKRAIDPLKKVFGTNLAGLTTAAGRLDALPVATGDAAFQFRVFPKIDLQVILWQGDEEFDAEANVVFDAAAGRILSPEDAAWAASLLVYRLMALSR
jgi:hypothetical protein